MKKSIRIVLFSAVIIGVIALAWVIRWHALTTLNVDYDEDDYLRAGQEYAQLMRAGDWGGFQDVNYRPEHPPLAKIMVGISIVNLPETILVPDRPSTASPNVYLPRNQLKNGRIANAIFGTLTAGLLAVVDPVAGIALAIHSFTVKYVSQIMLEALPAFFSLGSVLMYLLYRKKFRIVWLVLSAFLLGFTAASKYLYCVAGIGILLDWLVSIISEQRFRKEFPKILLWGGIAVAVFFAADPYLWPNPIERLKESILFHSIYSTSAEEVQNAGFPVWQPFYWLFSTPKVWQPEAIWIALDPLIAILAIFGMKRLWRKHRVMVIWIAVALIFLLFWPTKWPQYIVILTAPLCLAASQGLNLLVFDPIREIVGKLFSRRTDEASERVVHWKKILPWLIPGLIVFAVFTIFPLVYQFGLSMTDFNSLSIKDGFNGGIWRELWGGITGKIDPADADLHSRSTIVQFLGFRIYLPALKQILDSGLLFINGFWTVVSVLLQSLLGIGVGLLLWKKGLFAKKAWQILFILPWAIPEMIGALMWMNVFAPTTGWLSLGVQQYGETFPFATLMGWTGSQDLWMLVLLIAGVWYGFPFMMLATTAGLKMLPEDVFEAAQLDGANRMQVFSHILWPLLLPLIIPAVIIRSIFAFNQFYLFQAFYVNGVTLANVSYGMFHDGQYFASAIINVLAILFLVILVVMLNRSNKVTEGVTYA
jgi:arabinogalactan oligomer/maltooligosaccharide transport system permease protein